MIKITDNTIVKVFEGCKGLFEYEIILEDFSILKNNNKIKLLKNDCTLHFKSNFKYLTFFNDILIF